VPGNQGLPCLLKGLFGGAGNRGDGGLTGRGRITIQEIFYRDLGAFLSRSRAQIRAQHAQRRRILAISDVAFRHEPEWTWIDFNELTGPDCSGKYGLAPEWRGIGPEK
jgi:hypothetical protein